MATGSSQAEHFQQKFDPSDYLSSRYDHVDPVYHQHVLEGLHELFSNSDRECGGKILEIGCGPVIAWQISAAPHASEIVLAELVESNRDAIRLWLDKDPRAHNWEPFFRHVVRILEGKGEEEVVKREEQLRRAVKAVIPCDAGIDPPVPSEYEGPYDVVTIMAAFACVCKDEDDFVALWVRLAKLLKPGGTLIAKIYLVEGLPSLITYTYAVGEEKFDAMPFSEKLLRESLDKAGLSIIKLMKSPTAAALTSAVMQQGATYMGSAFLVAHRIMI